MNSLLPSKPVGRMRLKLIEARLCLLMTSGLLILSGCQSFLPPEGAAPAIALEGETVLGSTYIRRKQTIEVEGRFRDGTFHATRIEIEEDDNEVTIKGPIGSWTIGEGGAIGGATFEFTGKTRFRDASGNSVVPTAFKLGTWTKAECRVSDGDLLLRKITLRERADGELQEVQGHVSSVDHARGVLEIGGVTVSFAPDVLVVWDVQGQDAPGLQERRLDVAERTRSGLRRVRRRDDEDRRPTDQLTIGDFMTVGGEIQYDTQWRNNHNLQDRSDRDRMLHDLQSKIELSFDISPNIFAFAQIKGRERMVHFDQDTDENTNFDVTLGEAFFLLEDIPLAGVALQAGRQDFDHGREWVMDEVLDAVRLYANFDRALLEVSVSTVLFDEPDRSEGVTNFLVGLHFEPARDQDFFAWFLHRKGGTNLDLSRNHAGISGEGEFGDWSWWMDVGVVWGNERQRFFPGPYGAFTRRMSGTAYDVSLMYEFKDTTYRPYVFGGFAWSSGDDDNFGRRDGNFRQTGLHDNSDRFGGVTSYRYLGELVRPDLSNLMVFTLGAGFRPAPQTSVDLVLHYYRQVQSAAFMAPSRLRTMPTGKSAEIGKAVDLIIGLEDFRPIEIELVFSYFNPGGAFDTEDDAWFATFEIEWNF